MSIILSIFSIILTLAGIFIVPALIFLLIDYFDYRSLAKEYPVLKFKSFLSFYDINPDRWGLNYRTVECKINNKPQIEYGMVVSTNTLETFCFSYIDMKRYQHWHKSLDKYHTHQSHAKKTALMLAAVKEDIASIESLAKHEQTEAINILRSIHNI